MNLFEEFTVFATITGFKNYPNAKRLVEGDKVTLCRESNNEFDKSAISVFSEFGKIGYIANSEKTVRNGTLSATKLCELINDMTTAEVVEGGYYEAICKLENVFDTDKMILKACELYNSCEYLLAIELFQKICEEHSSVLLMQYTTDCLIKLDRYEDALNFAKRAFELEQDNKTSLMMYATVLHKLKKYEQAIELYKRILQICENELVRKALNECITMKKNENVQKYN